MDVPRIDLLLAAVLFVLGVLAVGLRMRRLEARINSCFQQLGYDLERTLREQEKRDELAQLGSRLHADIDSLHSMLGTVAADTKRLVAHAASEKKQKPESRMPLVEIRETCEEPPMVEDGMTQLLAIANRLVHQSVPTLDAFRASAGSFSAHVSTWPNSNEGQPVAFIVEHRGAYYAVPNVVRPSRLPKEWFNRYDFGVNDEIQHVVSLPRLTRRGNEYDVQDPGVFAR